MDQQTELEEYSNEFHVIQLQEEVQQLRRSMKGVVISSSENSNQCASNTNDIDFDDIFPIETMEQLADLEFALKKDTTFRKNMVSTIGSIVCASFCLVVVFSLVFSFYNFFNYVYIHQVSSMKKIGGSTGKLQWRKVANYIMKNCFESNLLGTFSFAGISKNKNIEPKPAFKQYPATIRFIFQIIYEADHSYTIIKNDEYLQNYFKHMCKNDVKRRTTDDTDDEEEILFSTKSSKRRNWALVNKKME